jgi:hypothetical protein
MSGSKNQGHADMGQVQEQAGQMLQSAREQATSQLSSQKERAVGSLGTLASVLHDAGRQARDQDQATVAQYVDVVADQVDSLATALKDQDLNQLIMSTGQFARRQPALFLAAAFAVGFAGARLLKSAAPQQGGGYGSRDVMRAGDGRGQYGYDSSGFGAGGYDTGRSASGHDSGYSASGYGTGAFSQGFGSESATSFGRSGSRPGESASTGSSSGGAGSSRTGDTLLGSDWTGQGSPGATAEER